MRAGGLTPDACKFLEIHFALQSINMPKLTATRDTYQLEFAELRKFPIIGNRERRKENEIHFRVRTSNVCFFGSVFAPCFTMKSKLVGTGRNVAQTVAPVLLAD